MKIVVLVGMLLSPAMALAFAPIETVATPTMGESALLSLSVVLPAIGVVALRRRMKRP